METDVSSRKSDRSAINAAYTAYLTRKGMDL